MKKIFVPFTLSLLTLSACGTEEESGGQSSNNDENTGQETRTYESQDGPVEVPANPERVAVLSTYAGNVMALDVNVVGVDSWAMDNPLYEDHLEGVETVSDDSLEKLAELEPDLIIGLDDTKNVDKLEEIAPVVTYTYGEEDYLSQHIEIGKLLNKEDEATEWVDDFEERASEAGSDIKEEIGEDTTVSVFENFEKQLYVFGDNWSRGTEILYQEMDLAMPEKVEEKALDDGYYTISPEVLPEYAGDYMIFSKVEDADNSFEETETYKNIPAVENDRVFEADATKFYFNGPIALEYQLDFFKEHFLNEK